MYGARIGSTAETVVQGVVSVVVNTHLGPHATVE
jgi:hypothetical protein